MFVKEIIISIQHRDIPDAQLHEPKGIVSAIAKAVYKSLGTGSGAWSRINQSDLDYSVKANNVFGWNDISDSQYTSGSPRAITSGTRTQLTNNATAVQTDVTRLGALWSTNQFLINDLNAFYTLRVNMKITAAAAAGTPYIATMEMQSANGPTVISGDTRLIKGGGAINQVSFAMPFYVGSLINNQALTLFLTADTAINIYDIGFTLTRSYKET